MEHKLKLEALNKEALEKLNDYLKQHTDKGPEQIDQIHKAKEDWQTSWNKMMETMVMLERLEI